MSQDTFWKKIFVVCVGKSDSNNRNFLKGLKIYFENVKKVCQMYVLVLFSWQWCRIWGSKAFCCPLKMFCFDKNHFCKILLHIRHPSQKISELQCLCFLSPTATYLHYFFIKNIISDCTQFICICKWFHPILKIPILMLHLMYK